MNILVTGAGGFIGRNLCAALENIRDGKDKTHPSLVIDHIFALGRNTGRQDFEYYCEKADFVFHLAGVNRAETEDAFMQGNVEATKALLDELKKQKNTCPVMLASSAQATCSGRYHHAYGRSKRVAEELVQKYGEETGAKVLIYRLPNVFGKWCRPFYNSVVATFCYQLANDMALTIHDETALLELVYIDDLIAQLLLAAEVGEHVIERHTWGEYCAVPVSYSVTVGQIADELKKFQTDMDKLRLPEMAEHSFEKKLYSTYLSYLPKEKICTPLKMNEDHRGSFTEVFKTEKCGQFSVNVTAVGETKGQHWHNSKWEIFLVVSGQGLIRMRKIGTEEVLEFPVSGEKPEMVRIPTGYTHEIRNCSQTQPLVTLMWANEQFDTSKPDTYFEKVGQIL